MSQETPGHPRVWEQLSEGTTAKQVSSSPLPVRTEVRVFPPSEYKHSLRRLSEHQPIRFLPQSNRRGVSRVCLFSLRHVDRPPTADRLRALLLAHCWKVGLLFLPSKLVWRAGCVWIWAQAGLLGWLLLFLQHWAGGWLARFSESHFCFLPIKQKLKHVLNTQLFLWGNLVKENGIFHSNWYFSETDLGFGEFKCLRSGSRSEEEILF